MSRKKLIAIEEVELLAHALQNIKTSLDDLINIADDLVPEGLFKKGIPEYFHELCKIIESEKKITLEVDFQGDFTSITDEIKIRLYILLNSFFTIIQTEIKTSKTSLRINFKENKLTITCQSSDISISRNRDSLKQKVDSIRGILEIKSPEDCKTEIIILLKGMESQ